MDARRLNVVGSEMDIRKISKTCQENLDVIFEEITKNMKNFEGNEESMNEFGFSESE